MRFLIAAAVAVRLCAAADNGPAWAYNTQPQPAGSAPRPAAAPDTSAKQVPGSSLSFTRKEIGNPFGPADWFPGDHPAMPEIVAHGKKPEVWACALCHYPNGKGRPENASVSGLPVSYFIHQMQDFRNGLRQSSDPRKRNTQLMAIYAKAMTDDEIKAAAEYFGAMPWTQWIRVVETEMVPKTHISVGMFLPIEGNEREPIGERIIEVPEDVERTEALRDPRSGFIAYVPVGSVKRGEALAKSAACGACHGTDLKGLGPVPGIAGRSPSYMVRQMWDMKQGARKGEWTSLMKPVVDNMSERDILSVAAYVAGLKP